MEELIKILQETYKGLDASDEELFHIAHTLLYRKEENVERLNTEIVIEDSDLELVQISIGDFIEYNNINEIDIPVHLLNNYYAETPSGMTRINAGVKKSKHDIIEIEFEDGTIQRVAEKHIYPQYDGVDKYADEVDYVITKNGKLTVKNKKFYSKDYVYDIGIANPHLYYTSDGILSHNSALMACIASNMVVSGKNVLYVTLEMSEEETAKRIDANILDIDINEFANTPIDTITKKFNSVKDKLGKLIIKEYPAGTFNTLHLEGLMAELATKGFIPDTIFIDYLGLMASSRTTLASSGGTYMYIKTIAEECHGFSKKYDLPVISASQLNRCMKKDTLVEKEDGSIIEIKDLVIGDIIKGYNKNVEVKQKVVTQKQKMHKVTLKSGKVITVSGTHRFPSKLGLISVETGLVEGVYINSK